MIRGAVLIAIAAAAGLPAQPPSAAPGKNTTAAWRTSWPTFVSEYNACIKSAKCDHKRFVDREVVWEGTVTSIDFDKAGVGFEMAGPHLTEKRSDTNCFLTH